MKSATVNKRKTGAPRSREKRPVHAEPVFALGRALAIFRRSATTGHD
jgi:hypothetical protein